jgi:hypothetical protein
MENNRDALIKAVEGIKNCAAARGIIITDDEMAQKIAMTRELMLAYLRDEYDTIDNLSSRLESAYKELLKDVTEVAIIEDIHMIISQEN